MEFVIEKRDLVHELQTVTGVVEKRATIPILANLLIEASKDGLLVGASDLEVAIRGRAKAKISSEGSVTLPAGKLLEIARSLPEAEVKFKLLERNQVAISCDRTKYRISGQPKDEFPAFPEINEARGVKLPGRVLHGMIERVTFAITTEDPRYSLNGALILLKDSQLTLVATDGHRLAFASREVGSKSKEEQKIVVPRKALAEVSKMTADLGADDEVLFGRSESHVFFVVGEHRLTSNVLEGNFPRYENVMPISCATKVLIPTQDLAQAVRRVSLLASDRYGKAVRFGLSSGKLELFSRTEMGEAQETLIVDYDGPEMSIGFNARYLMDFLGVVGSLAVSLELNPVRPGDDERKAEAGDKPGQFKPEPQEGIDYRYIVMPMHI